MTLHNLVDDEDDEFYEAYEEFNAVEEDSHTGALHHVDHAQPTLSYAPNEQQLQHNVPPLPEKPISHPSADVQQQTSQPESNLHTFPLHRAAWDNDAAKLRQLLQTCTRQEMKALDVHGNTVMHVAVVRQHADCVHALIDAGFPCHMRNGRGWAPAYEAVEVGNRELAVLLSKSELVQVRAEIKAKKAAVMATLKDLPDLSLQLHWEISSSVPGVGLLLRRYMPHDTYTIWKQGACIRVDGSLMGTNEDAGNLLPDWKRGHFSVIYDGSGQKSGAYFINHGKKKYVDLKATRKTMVPVEESVLEQEIDELMAKEYIKHKKVKSHEVKFKPVKSWLGNAVTERVEGWSTMVYEASGSMLSVTKYKMPYNLPANMTFDEYLAADFQPDYVVEKLLNPMSVEALTEKSKGSESAPPPPPKARGPSFTFVSQVQSGSTPHRSPSYSYDADEAEDPKLSFSRPRSNLGRPQAPADPATGAAEAVVTAETASSSSGKPAAPPTYSGTSARTSHAGKADEHHTNAGGSSSSNTHDSHAFKQSKHKRLSGRCWMAKDFPLSLHQLLPLLEVVGSANKHIAKVSKFMAKYGNLEMFPVKVQVPLIMTVYIVLSFKHFKITPPSKALPASFFAVPEGFKLSEPKDVQPSSGAIQIGGISKKKHKSKLGSYEDDLDDADTAL